MSKIFDNIEIYGSGTTSNSRALSVYNSAGTTTLVVKDNGSVGIGTATPSTTLDVSGITTFRNVIRDGAGTTIIDINSNYVLNDNAGNASLYLGARQLYRSGLVALDWSSRVAKNSTNFTTFSWEGCSLYDALGTGSTEWSVRRLLNNSGNENFSWATTPTFKGQRADASGNSLLIQNSAGTQSLSVRDDGKVLIQTLTAGLGGGNISTNTTFGLNALLNNTTGFQNTAIGGGALNANTTATGNTAVGYGTLTLNGGSGGGHDNTAFGNEALVLNNTAGANRNTGIGSGALRTNTSGGDNTAVGYKAGNDTDVAYGSNSIGQFNIWVGSKASTIGTAVDEPSYTVVVGYSAKSHGSSSISIGSNSMVYSASSVSIGASNRVIGTNSTAIGPNVVIYSSNTMVLGNGVNVGIGTATPSEKLHVSGGTIRINTSNATEGAGKLAVSDANGSISFSSTTALGISTTGSTVTKYTTTTTLANSGTTITHNLNTNFIICAFWDATGNPIIPQYQRINANSIGVSAATTGTYDVVIHG